jgi:hypothetical protein
MRSRCHRDAMLCCFHVFCFRVWPLWRWLSLGIERKYEVPGHMISLATNFALRVSTHTSSSRSPSFKISSGKHRQRQRLHHNKSPIMSLVSGEKSNFQFILRLLNTNVEGKQKVMYALTKIKGVGRRYSNLVCKKADVDLNKRYAMPPPPRD